MALSSVLFVARKISTKKRHKKRRLTSPALAAINYMAAKKRLFVAPLSRYLRALAPSVGSFFYVFTYMFLHTLYIDEPLSRFNELMWSFCLSDSERVAPSAFCLI